MANRTNDRFDVNVARILTTTLLQSDYSTADLRRIANLLKEPEFTHRLYLALEDYIYNLDPKAGREKSPPQRPSSGELEGLLQAIRRKKMSRKAVLRKIRNLTQGKVLSGAFENASMESIVEAFLNAGSDEQIADFVDDVNPGDDYLNYIGRR